MTLRRFEARVVNDPKWNILDKFTEDDFETIREQLRNGSPDCPLPLYEKIKHFFDPPTEFPRVEAAKEYTRRSTANARFRKSNYAAIIASAYPAKWGLYDFITKHRISMMGRDRIILPYVNKAIDLRTYYQGGSTAWSAPTRFSCYTRHG